MQHVASVAGYRVVARKQIGSPNPAFRNTPVPATMSSTVVKKH
jgi:hypothetical protein